MDVTPFGDKLLKGWGSARDTVDELRNQIRNGGAGITIQYPFVTIRWGDPLKSVTMVIVEVDNGVP
jgi:hypothetical protein